MGQQPMALDGDFLVDAAKRLLPPGSEPNTSRARYDWTVSLTLLGVIIVGGLHIAQACGFLTSLGLGGFAMASDVTTQQATLAQIQQSQIAHEVRDAKRQICIAQQARNQPALSSWSMQLESAKGQYYALTKQWPNVMNCDELLVTGSVAQ